MFDLLRPFRPSHEHDGLGFARPGLPAWLWASLFAAVLAGLVTYETRTSAFEAGLFSELATHLTWRVGGGPSDRIVFPTDGPYDVRLGYTRIPAFTRQLEGRGFRPLEQARFSPALEAIARLGITPPYDEPDDAGLVVTDADGDTLYDLTPRGRTFARYEDIPPLVVSCLLYMENRQLEQPPDAHTNPTVDWGRLGKATFLYAGHRMGLPVRLEGGSTLATQIEKYRHSDGGRTESPVEKLRQIVAASLKVYREGADTRAARRQIVVDYLNTMPLASAPGYGAAHGLGEGLYAWFGMDLGEVTRALAEPGVTPAKARALKHVLALLYAVRAPSSYLVRGHRVLEARVSNCATVLEQAGVLRPALASGVRSAPLEFHQGPVATQDELDPRRKPLYSLRTLLARNLGIASFYDLDRLHLEVESTLDEALQDSALVLFRRLRDPAFVASHGLTGEHLLSSGDPQSVVYGLLLYERTPQGDLERVHVDNLAEPFDVNRSMKMELGSTAKLRTLTHYLQIVATLYDSLSGAPAKELARRAAEARDPLTTWAATTLAAERELDRRAFLERSLDRSYSANPGEVFFTGGGVHVFHNFDRDDDHRVLPVREAVARSVNLVFVRLMRDIVRYHAGHLPYDADAVLTDAAAPARQRLLAEMADQEAWAYLYRAWREQRGLSPAELEALFLGPARPTPGRLATLFYAWHPGATPLALDRWLQAHDVVLSPAKLAHLAKVYAPLTLSDDAFLLRRHPLSLWCAGQLARKPDQTWEHLRARSAEARRAASNWLFKTSNRRAQDLRLRIRIEQDAFARMTPYWRGLGFPFAHLVPSLATAIGSSSDRPEALARLMGILLNDGVDRPPVALSRLAFGPKTPYTTVLAATPPSGRHVLSPVIARIVRETLLGVVDHGTAVRLKGAFVTAAHDTLPVGGKTGSGDNRYQEFARGGRLVASLPVNRTAAFVFYIGDRWYGVISAMVVGPQSGGFAFTSSLPVAALRLYAPAILERVSQPAPAAAQLMAAHLVGQGQAAARDTTPVKATSRDSSAGQPAGRDSAAGRVAADTAAPAAPDSVSATRVAWRAPAGGHHRAPNHRIRSPGVHKRGTTDSKGPPPTHPGL